MYSLIVLIIIYKRLSKYTTDTIKSAFRQEYLLMPDFFNSLENALLSSSVNETIEMTRQAFELCHQNSSFIEPVNRIIKPIDFVRFPDKPICVAPRDLPRRRLGTEAGKRSFIHAIAHIEFNAIKLALDIAYRFKGMPAQFYKDWVYVANDECKHFQLLCNHLATYDCQYGDNPSHDGLWSMAVKTDDNLLARLSLVPRYLEARGLDVTPAMLEKLYAQKDMDTAAILEIILEDEVTHVEFGTKWLDFVCENEGVEREDVFFEHVERLLKGQILGPFNKPLRLRAGFTPSELLELERLDKRKLKQT
ncbi:hypothetical protein CYCME_1495 [Cycloclasticus zancles 78-ME]|uniref:Ferritin-like domain-containing protein n=2 Tax=Piscirickettsiaceae TaxID=135616 RepID=S5TXF6_9GAMM|nr:hypothetical protein CYCME_1495 [Cycloclasticus zancles 78-ME]